MNVFAGRSQAQPVITHPDASIALDERWAWALTRSKTTKTPDGFWIGYSIRRLMGEHSSIGTYITEWKGQVSFKSVVEGVKDTGQSEKWSDEERLRRAASEALESSREHEREETGKKVWKDVALLFRFSSGSTFPSGTHFVTMSNPFDLKDRPMFWLGSGENKPGLDMLTGMYRQAPSVEMKKNLLSAIGVHQEPDYVVPFLQKTLNGQEENEIRKQAAFWLGQSDVPAALDMLKRAARTDRSMEVRKQAVFGIGQLDLENATEALIELARQTGEMEVRKQAIFWLAQRASKNVSTTLRGFLYDDSETEIKKQALFALTQLKEDEGVPVLIEVARNHDNPETRKQAIFWLGQSDDPRAFETLVDIARKPQ